MHQWRYTRKGWLVDVFYSDYGKRKGRYYSQIFNNVEMDITFYKRFYKYICLVFPSRECKPDNDKRSDQIQQLKNLL